MIAPQGRIPMCGDTHTRRGWPQERPERRSAPTPGRVGVSRRRLSVICSPLCLLADMRSPFRHAQCLSHVLRSARAWLQLPSAFACGCAAFWSESGRPDVLPTELLEWCMCIRAFLAHVGPNLRPLASVRLVRPSPASPWACMLQASASLACLKLFRRQTMSDSPP